MKARATSETRCKSFGAMRDLDGPCLPNMTKISDWRTLVIIIWYIHCNWREIYGLIWLVMFIKSIIKIHQYIVFRDIFFINKMDDQSVLDVSLFYPMILWFHRRENEFFCWKHVLDFDGAELRWGIPCPACCWTGDSLVSEDFGPKSNPKTSIVSSNVDHMSSRKIRP